MKSTFIFSLIAICSGLNINIPIKTYKKFIDDKVVKVFEPQNVIKNKTSCVIFYTGANSLIPGEIYTEFINNLVQKNLSVHVSPNNQELSEDLVYELLDEYQEVIPLSHSSGCINAIKNSNKNRNIKNVIFMDPVDNRELLNSFGGFFNPLAIWQKKEEKADKLKYVDNILLLNAKKSYEWKLYPFTVPFIPGFSLKDEELFDNDVNKIKIEATEYGHSDILDNLWSDLMHGTISKGYEERDEEKLALYRLWLVEVINSFIKNNKIEDEDISDKVKYSYKI